MAFRKWILDMILVVIIQLNMLTGVPYEFNGIGQRVQPDNIRQHLRYLTNKPHLGGTAENNDLAMYIYNQWIEQGLEDVKYYKYDVMLSYPDWEVHNEVNIIDTSTGEVIFAADGKQTPLQAPEEADPRVIPNFNAYSRPGTIQGDLVYVHYGTKEDFDWIQGQGIDLHGKIVLARYGAIFRGNIVKLAEQYNASGAIIYSDPKDFAQYGRNNVYPTNDWMPGSGTQSGTLLLETGDPLTPNYPSVDGVYRRPVNESGAPKIVVQPIGYDDAEQFLRLLGGIAPPTGWQGTLNATYNIGPGFVNPNLKVVLDVKTHDEITPITNVIGLIRGAVEPDRYVIISNHRDAWEFGAIDPSSGTAAMLEVSRVLGQSFQEGWRPRRSIIFASWDVEEYGLIGSTEWVEDNLKLLSDGGVVVLNVDLSVFGTSFIRVLSVPILYQFEYDILKTIANPNKGEVAQGLLTVYDSWLYNDPDSSSPISNKTLPRIRDLGAGSDFAPFMYLAGVPGRDISYAAREIIDKRLVCYPLYHTMYETFYAVDSLIDPGFIYHGVIAQIWAEEAHQIADSVILPFNVIDYASYICSACNEFESIFGETLQQHNITLDYFKKAVENFANAAAHFHAKLAEINLNDPIQVRIMNDKLMQVDRAFLKPEGLPNRPTIRHVVFAPSGLNTYAGSAFSGVTDLIQVANSPNSWEAVKKELSNTVYYVNSAASVLKVNL